MLLILLKDEYRDGLDGLAGDPTFRDFVCALGQALYEGRHAVKGPPLLLEGLSQWPGLSEPQAEALAAAARDAVRPILPYDQVTDALVITGPDGPGSGSPASGTTWHRLDWARFGALGGLRPTALVGEHLSDAEWFGWLARAYAARTRPSSTWAGTEVRLDCHLGGGDTTGLSIEGHVRAGAPTLCIVDSDRNHPTATLGDTAKHAQRSLRRLKSVGGHPPAELEVLAARDVENLLPIPLLEAAISGTGWLAPMIAAGFFVGPERSLDPTLAWVDAGKTWCAVRLTDTADPDTRALREDALGIIRVTSAESAPCPAKDGEATCAARDGKKWGEVPDGCALVHSVGKPLERLLKHIEKHASKGSPAATAGWLASLFRADEAAVWGPARRAWSWGLGVSRRVH